MIMVMQELPVHLIAKLLWVVVAEIRPAVAVVGQDLFIELFSDPEILADRYDQVLQSALVEAVAHPSREVIPVDQVEGLMDDLVEVSRDSKLVQNRSLRDSGRSLVFSSKGISGSALLSGDRVIHLSAHKRCWGSGRPFAEQVRDLIRDQSEREEEGQDHARQIGRVFSKRKKRYRSFVDSLTPSVTHQAVDDPDYFESSSDSASDDAPLPRPLSAPIHDFFIQLFRH